MNCLGISQLPWAAGRRLGVLVACLVLHVQTVAAADSLESVSKEPFSTRELQAGRGASKDECATQKHAVWAEHAYGSECIRYYPSAGLEGGENKPKLAVFYFHGDHLAGTSALGNYDKKSPYSLTSIMQKNYREYGVPFILVARPGVYGSSGDHKQRRRPKEFHALNAAVDAIKLRYGLEQVILAGQSGGSTVGAALLTLGRRDVSCAALASGNYDVVELAEIKRSKTGQRSRRGCDVTDYCDPYNVIDHVAGIAADPQRIIYLVGDPQDQNTVFPLQQKFAEAVRAAGHRVELVEAEGKGPDRHYLEYMAYRTAGTCAERLDSEHSSQRFTLEDGARNTADSMIIKTDQLQRKE